mmetsp:Transcript_119708/g.334133  ORF Transcript_119708/g.334133 Transcript_119708/m.334133 type:complete len:212 (-) Transcript_119708:49-684(-)
MINVKVPVVPAPIEAMPALVSVVLQEDGMLRDAQHLAQRPHRVRGVVQGVPGVGERECPTAEGQGLARAIDQHRSVQANVGQQAPVGSSQRIQLRDAQAEAGAGRPVAANRRERPAAYIQHRQLQPHVGFASFSDLWVREQDLLQLRPQAEVRRCLLCKEAAFQQPPPKLHRSRLHTCEGAADRRRGAPIAATTLIAVRAHPAMLVAPREA